ncbi:MAG: ribonuclease E/G, partial [Planctomycetota bacterium]
AIDVNSAKSRDQDDLEGTAVLTNTEAAAEIARQLRLRDIGGVVVCDFIDMLDAQNRRQVETTLRDALRGDRSKTWIARMSRFGLIEMTRQRLRPSKDKVGRRPCPTCNGRGTIRSPHLLADSIFRQLRNRLFDRKVSGAEVWAGTHLLEYLANDVRDELIQIEDAADKDVTLHLGDDLATDAFELHFTD